MRRYLIEIGSGTVLHGGDCTKAAARALKDAVSHCCMAGVKDIFDLKDFSRQVRLEIRIGVPYPEKVDIPRLYEEVDYTPENAAIEVVKGGLEAKGLYEPRYGEGDHIIVANAAVTVFLDV